ncbi:hypothetical protein B0H13DRAFT_1900579 [Mycena leptocephala]|nr:hypothetical protein B0H13DRAFT_1900579 [Mycena leptocephala]
MCRGLECMPAFVYPGLTILTWRPARILVIAGAPISAKSGFPDETELSLRYHLPLTSPLLLFAILTCIHLSSLAAAAGATTTLVVGGTITAGVADGTTMIATGADKEAGVAGTIIGGIRCGVMCAQNDGPLEKRYTGLLRWARVAGILFLSGELDIPKLQTFVAAGDRYLLAVNWTAKFATTGAPF